MKKLSMILFLLIGINSQNAFSYPGEIDPCFSPTKFDSNTWSVFINGITYGLNYQLIQVGIRTTSSPFIDMKKMEKWVEILKMEIPKEKSYLYIMIIMAYLQNEMLLNMKNSMTPEQYQPVEERVVSLLGWSRPVVGSYSIIQKWMNGVK